MAFQVKNKRNSDGSYQLSYGKGKNKLYAEMANGTDGWKVLPGNGTSGSYPQMKQCKAAWGAWAEKNYAGNNGVTEKAGPSHGPPPLPVRNKTTTIPPVPPARVKETKPVEFIQKKPPLLSDYVEDYLQTHQFTHPRDHPVSILAGQNTPMGVLISIHRWWVNNQQYVNKMNDFATHHSGFDNPFDNVILDVRECVEREITEKGI